MIEEQQQKELLTVSTNDIMDKYREKYNQAEFELAVKEQQVTNLLKKIKEQDQLISNLKAQTTVVKTKNKPIIDVPDQKNKEHKNK